jgi:hypothetical protein
VLLALLICVAAATSTVLHAASSSHDAEAAASVIVLDAAPAAHAPVGDGGGVVDCLGAAMICIAAIGLLLLVTAQARRSTWAEPIPASGSAPPRVWLSSFLPLAAPQTTGLLRI